MTYFAGRYINEMNKKSDPVYSRSVVEFVAAANEFCKYAEYGSEVPGDELLRIFQRLLPYLYIKASLLPATEPVFEDGNEKFVTEADWNRVHDTLKDRFGAADDYYEVFDDRIAEGGEPVIASLSENIADIYQDLKDFLLLYQTGSGEVMNDAVWECRMNFENIWGQKLVNSLRAIHRFIYSGESTDIAENGGSDSYERNKSEWFISRRQKEFREDAEE